MILTVLECKSKLLDGTPFMSKPTLCFEDGAKCTTAQLLQVIVGLPWQARRWKWQHYHSNAILLVVTSPVLRLLGNTA